MITFLIPTYNEFLNIERIVNKINKLALKKDYVIFFVDDNSNDGSISKFTKLKEENNNIDFYIRKTPNKDLTQSIIDALKFIDSEYIFVLDCDLQHDVNSIPIMINLLIDKDYDLVIGVRDISAIQSFKRRYISFIGIWLTKILGIKKLVDPLSGFFVIKTDKLKKISPKIKSKGYKILLSIIFYLPKTTKIKEVNIKFYPRKYEKSKLNFKVIILFFLQIIKLILLRIIGFFRIN